MLRRVAGGLLGLYMALWVAVIGPPAHAAGQSRAISIQPEDNSGSTFEFAPNTLNATTDDLVYFANHTSVTHDVKFDEGGPRSEQGDDTGPIGPGQTSVQYRLAPGRHPYHCTIHSYMTGAVEVTQAVAPLTTTTTTPTRDSTAMTAAQRPATTTTTLGPRSRYPGDASSTSTSAGVTTTVVDDGGRLIEDQLQEDGGGHGARYALIGVTVTAVLGLGAFGLRRMRRSR